MSVRNLNYKCNNVNELMKELSKCTAITFKTNGYMFAGACTYSFLVV